MPQRDSIPTKLLFLCSVCHQLKINVVFYVFTERQNGSQVFEEQQHGGREAWGRMEEDPRFATTPPDGQFPMQNGGHVKFEVPKVPVIFVLGRTRLLL